MLGQKAAESFTHSYSGGCSNGTEHFSERVSMAKANLPNRRQRVSSKGRETELPWSSTKSVYITVQTLQSGSLPSPPLAHLYGCTLYAVCYRSLLLLWSHVMKQRAVKVDREFFWFWGPLPQIKPWRFHFNFICAIGCHGIFGKVIFENARGGRLIFGIS